MTDLALAQKFNSVGWDVADNGCWLWGGSCNNLRGGYGQMHYGGKVLRAHRVSVEVNTGAELAPTDVVIHKCDNPPCVNPDHLKVGTQAENLADMTRKGRRSTKTTDQQVREIRASTSGTGELASRYGVTRRVIWLIRTGQARKDVK